MKTVLIAHPTRQHAYQFALALENAELLQSFWTLLPDERHLSWVIRHLKCIVPSPIFRHSLKGLPKKKIHVFFGPLYFYKLTTWSRSHKIRDLGELAAWMIFDFWVAFNLAKFNPNVIVGYEMCCLKTFATAKKLGMRCVLDAAACHYSWVDRELPSTISGCNTWAGKRLRQRKELEIKLADKIICTSDFARKTYLEAGVDSEKIAVNVLGYDKSIFFPTTSSSKSSYPTFIFVGQPAYHKGFDILVDAFNKLLLSYPNVRLLVIGSSGFSGDQQSSGGITFLGKLSHNEIKYNLMQSDCLVLPSRCESFGMAALEAIGAGVPVIVSKNAGVSSLVKEGVSGWVIQSGDSNELYLCMKKCCDNLKSLRSMAEACSKTVESYEWNHYSKRAVEIIDHLY